MYINVDISDHEAACFLVPRAVTDKAVRARYTDAGRSIRALEIGELAFDAIDLFNYLKGKTVIRVGAEERPIEPGRVDCLADPTPYAIAILSGPTKAPATIEVMKSGLAAMNLPVNETESDLPGYRRYISKHGSHHEDYYFPDSGADTRLAFWCGTESEADVCHILGKYGGMTTAIAYLKQDMTHVSPGPATGCVRSIGELFRVK